MKTIELEIQGMTCPSCVPHVESRLSAVRGVEATDVRYPAGTAAVTVEGVVDQADLIGALADTPYSATAVADPVAGPAAARTEHPENGSDGPASEDGRFDLAVIGGGSAGFAAAIRVVERGGRVAMVNDGLIGGTCVNVGCVPSKALIRAAEARHGRGHHPFDGIARSDEPVQWDRVRSAKDDLVDALRGAKYIDVLKAYPEITLIEGRATLGPDAQLRLTDGAEVPAKHVVIATGSSPWAPNVPGLEESGYLDSTALLDIDALPESLAVIGAGSVGLELAQAYSRLGVRVTVLARSRLLSHGDPDVSVELAGHLRDEGIDVLTSVKMEAVECTSAGRRIRLTADGSPLTLDTQEILVAAGRRPNTNGLGLEAAGVDLGPGGEVVVDDHMRTTNPRVYAAGDVVGEPMHVYVAAYEASIVAENVMGGEQSLDLSVMPQVTFTDPGVASAGLTEAEARAQGMEPLVSKLGLEHLPRALAARDPRGFVKLVADAATRRIVGAHILAPEAGEMIMEPALAIRFGLTIEHLTSTLHPYLTHAEGIKLAALTFEKDVAMLSCCAA